MEPKYIQIYPREKTKSPACCTLCEAMANHLPPTIGLKEVHMTIKEELMKFVIEVKEDMLVQNLFNQVAHAACQPDSINPESPFQYINFGILEGNTWELMATSKINY